MLLIELYRHVMSIEMSCLLAWPVPIASKHVCRTTSADSKPNATYLSDTAPYWTTSSTTGSYFKVALMSAVHLNERPQITCLMQFKASPPRHMFVLSQGLSEVIAILLNVMLACTVPIGLPMTHFACSSKQHQASYVCFTTGLFFLKLLTYCWIECWQALYQ